MYTNDNIPIIESRIVDNFLIVEVKTFNKIQITITNMSNQQSLFINVGGKTND